MILGLDWWVVVACLITVAIGSSVQATIGIGMGMLAAPVLGLADPAFLPATIMISVLPLSVGVAVRDWDAVNWVDVRNAFIGRVPGIALGAAVVAMTGPRAIAVIVGVSVLTAVAVSLTDFRFRTTPRNLRIAGVFSGIFGTATGVGGPPMALTYQHETARVMRATLAVYFGFGSTLSILALTIAGEVGGRQIELSLLLLPAVMAGLVLSGPVIARLPEARVRVAVLALCTVSSTALLLEAL